MRLKHLTLQGYKSFANKTEFLFPTGITAIVGPNGSGKSNVADAIRWVLGEQSMRSLRGKSSADMIFAGGQRRARAGLAEASLTLDNSDEWLPIEFSEVTITRRAHRSGENEYLINGSRVRLRDVNELLAESGLSERAYAVIGQGLIDTALSLRPQERRTLIEEAAGITLYRARREDAIQRLEETRHNLERVHDIVSEITPRLKRLEREVQQVEEHQRVTAHLQRLQRTWYGYQWGRQQTALGHALQLVDALEGRLKARQEEASKLSDELAQIHRQESELRTRLRDWHHQSADLHDRANEVRRELAVAEERTRLLKARREELLAEIEPLNGQREAQVERVDQARAEVERLQRELAEQKTRLADLEHEWAALQERAQEPARRRAQMERELHTLRAELKRLNQALTEARTLVANLASERAVAQERARQLEARREEILAELKPLSDQEAIQAEQVEETRSRVAELERQLVGRREHVAKLERQWAAAQHQAQEPDPQQVRLEQALQTHREETERVDQILLEARAEVARLTGERQALDRMYATGAAYSTGVQALLQADLDGVLGPLAALIQVPPEWDRAVEAALGADLQAIVVERAAIVEEARRIVEEARGRVILLPLDRLHAAPPLPPAALCAADVVACDAPIRPAVETLLGPVTLCDDLMAAQTLLSAMPPEGRCATRAGIVLRADGATVVGQVGEGGVLADERARRELAAQLEKIHRQCEEMEKRRQDEADRVAALENELAELARRAAQAREEAAQAERERIAEARTEVAVAEEALRGQQAALQREENALERLRAQKSSLQQQARQLEAQQTSLVSGMEDFQAQTRSIPPSEAPEAGREERDAPGRFQAHIEEAQQRCRRIEEQQQATVDRVTRIEGELEGLAREAATEAARAAQFERETLSQARTEIAVVEEALRSQQATRQREAALLERLRAQISARRQRAEDLRSEHATLVVRVEELGVEASQMESQLGEMRQRIEPAEETLTRLGDEQTTLEGQERQARDRVRDAEARQVRAQLKADRRRDELKILARHIEEDLGLVQLELDDNVTAQTPLPMRPMVSELPIVEVLPAGLEEEIQRLKARLRRLGSVNPNAPANYADVRERHQFLSEQSADLERASAQLRQVVEELDELMETAFCQTFDAVAARFSETFTTLFDGGSAHLELTEPNDLMNTGVDIVARPPGKRAQRLALLSGGERALTAAALIFALLHVSPAPFCVLDEVDAMLDEANVGRFRNLLEELSQQTQFVVITHNRGTIEAADTIYGVSMGADGVSQTVSLKIDEYSA